MTHSSSIRVKARKELAFVRPASAGQSSTLGVLNSLDMTWKWTDAIPLSTHSIAPPLMMETRVGYLPPLSSAQVRKARPICFRLHVQHIRDRLAPCLATAGTTSAAKMPRQAMTMSSSITVKASARLVRDSLIFGFSICLIASSIINASAVYAGNWPSSVSQGRDFHAECVILTHSNLNSGQQLRTLASDEVRHLQRDFSGLEVGKHAGPRRAARLLR